MGEVEEIRYKVTQKIDEVERAVESLQGLRKTLLQKAYETKQSILTAFIDERNSMHSREVRLLGEVDSLHHTKDDAVVIQLSKLNQVLGCLRNCLQSEHPCGECLEKYEDLDMVPVSDISSDFASASEQLKRALSGGAAVSTPFSKMDLTGQARDVMQWLLAPTNMKRHRDSSERFSSHTATAGKPVESHVTEWLLQYHSGNITGTITASAGMGSIFSGVKLDKSENWLRSDKQYLMVDAKPNQQFTTAASQSTKDWLVQDMKLAPSPDGNESGNSVGSSTTSTASSSAISSYVVLPSSDDSEVSAYGMGPTSQWLRQESSSRSVSSDPVSSVSDWVASCKREESGSARGRLVSMSSLANDLLSVHGDVESLANWRLDSISAGSNNWLLSKPTPSANETSYSKPSSDWLRGTVMSDSGWLLKENQSRWVAVQTNKRALSECDMQVEEKHDVVAEKSENDDWLRSDGNDERWLMSQKQVLSDEPHGRRKSCQDRDWLMVVNTMSQISRSDDASWLVQNSTM